MGGWAGEGWGGGGVGRQGEGMIRWEGLGDGVHVVKFTYMLYITLLIFYNRCNFISEVYLFLFILIIVLPIYLPFANVIDVIIICNVLS